MANGWYFLDLVYHNAADPKVWVPKRVGWGWTLNFAHGEAWAWIGTLTAFLGVTAWRIRSQK